METLSKFSRIAFCIGLAGMVVPQYIYHEFGPNFFPAWPGFQMVSVSSFVFTTIVLALCAVIMAGKHGRIAALFMGNLLLMTYCLGYIPFELMINPNKNILGSWGDGLKEPALGGGAFVIAASFPKTGYELKERWIRLLGNLARN